MGCGCVVVGYDGFGGREYFNPEYCYPVEQGDVLSFVKTVELVIEEHGRNAAAFSKKGQAASESVLKTYSLEHETMTVLNFWREVCQRYSLVFKPDDQSSYL